MGSKTTERKKAQRKRKKQREMIPIQYIDACGAIYSLGNLQTLAPAEPQVNKESKMFYNLDDTSSVEGTQRNFLMNDLSSSFHEHKEALLYQFNMAEGLAPRTFAELVTAIETKQYTPPEKDLARDWRTDVLSRPKWGDPTKKPDSVGYELAMKALEKAYSDAQRDVITLAVSDARTAAMNLEAWTYTAPTVH